MPIHSTYEVLKLFRDQLQSISDLTKRRAAFENGIVRVGLRFRNQDGLYSIHVPKGSCPPLPNWKGLANTIMSLDAQSLPVVLAYGTQELYNPLELNEVLDNAAIGHYRVEPILFGTVCWLYFLDDKWHLATKRMADVGNTSMRKDGPSFADAFEEAAHQALKLGTDAHESAFDALTKKLTTRYTYGFVLYHRDVHLFAYGGFKTKLWHVSTYHNDTGARIHGSIGVSMPPTYHDASVYIDTCSPTGNRVLRGTIVKPKVGTSIVEMSDLRNRVLKEYARSSDATGSRVGTLLTEKLPAALENDQIIHMLRNNIKELCELSSNSLHASGDFFGVILRSKNAAVTFPNTNVIIKSPLYVFIERYIGKAVPLRSTLLDLIYAPSAERATFLRFLPHFQPLLEKAVAKADSLSKMVLSYHSENPYDGDSSEESSPVGRDTRGVKIPRLHDMIVRAIGSRNFTAQTVSNELLNPNGSSRRFATSLLLNLL